MFNRFGLPLSHVHSFDAVLRASERERGTDRARYTSQQEEKNEIDEGEDNHSVSHLLKLAVRIIWEILAYSRHFNQSLIIIIISVVVYWTGLNVKLQNLSSAISVFNQSQPIPGHSFNVDKTKFNIDKQNEQISATNVTMRATHGRKKKGE